jgi:hypothetical protein
MAPRSKQERMSPKGQTRERFAPASFNPAEFPNMTFAPADGMAFTMPTSNPVATRSAAYRYFLSASE